MKAGGATLRRFLGLLGERRFWAFGLLWLLGAALAWGYATHRTEPYGGWFYDLSVAWNPLPDPSPTSVLLIESHNSIPEDSALTRAIARATSLGAAAVAIAVELPETPSTELLEALSEAPKPVLALRPVPSIEAPRDALPAAYHNVGMRLAVLDLEAPELGVYRRQGLVSSRYGHAGQPTLEAAMAPAPTTRTTSAGGRSFLVNFLRGPHRVPRVALEEAHRLLVRPLVEGRSVIIGYAPGLRQRPLHTPVDARMSELEFHGYALQTLLDGRPIRTFGLAVMLLVFTSQLFLWSYLYARVGPAPARWATAFFVIAVLLVGAALTWLRFWPAVTEILLYQGLIAGAWVLRGSALKERTLRRIMAETSRYTRSRIIPASFYATDEPWEYIARLLYETLPIQKMALLERIPGIHRVRFVPSIHCVDESEIMERRRDFHRTPYTTALAQSGPVAIARPFFHPRGESSEDNYLVALIFAGEVQGFWAFTLQAGPDREQRLQLAEALGRRISEMLYHRSRWVEQTGTRSRWISWLDFQEWNQQLLTGVTRSLAFIEWRLVSLEYLFHGVDHALVLYDFFGQLLYANQPMETLMRQARIPFYRMSALQLVCALGEMEENEARDLLARVRVEHDTISLSARALEDSAHAYRVLLRRLAQDPSKTVKGENPFHFEGILLVCQDTSLVKAGLEARMELLQTAVDDIRNFRERLRATLERSDVSDSLHQATAHVLRDLERTLAALREKYDPDQNRATPVRLQPLVEMALRSIAPQVQKKKLELVTSIATAPAFVRVVPTRFVEGLKAVAERMVSDAKHRGRFTVTLRSAQDEVTILLEDEGYGIVQEDLDALLASPQGLSEGNPLPRFVKDLQEWGGDLRAAGVLGAGLRFQIRLPAVL